MTDRFTEQLSRYADGEMGPAERAAMEQHLAACPDCRSALAQLAAVKSWAPGYEGLPPARDLWAGIESRLGTRPISTAPGTWHQRRVTLRAPLLAAAAVILLVLGAGLMWLLRPGTMAPGLAETPHEVRQFNVALANATDEQYDAAVEELEAILASNDTALEPETLRVIRQSLATIDQAIDDARAAIARDSTNDFLNASIQQNMRRKLEILRTATLAATAKS